MIYVQHLLGIGHLQRSASLANALAREGFTVELVSGGMPHPLKLENAVRLSQLPPLRVADSSFSELIDGDGKAAGMALKQERERLLIDLFYRFAPRVLITASIVCCSTRE